MHVSPNKSSAKLVGALAIASVFAATACGVAGGRDSAPASAGVRTYIAALRADNPERAYRMLTDDLRAEMTHEEFVALWREYDDERHRQAAALDEQLKGAPSLGERAAVVFADGKTVHLRREHDGWKMESELVSRVHAKTPRDAVTIFADAVIARSYSGALRIMTRQRRETIARKVQLYGTSLRQHKNSDIDLVGDRAVMRWHDRGYVFTIQLLKEDGEWRVDDVDMYPIPDDDTERD